MPINRRRRQQSSTWAILLATSLGVASASPAAQVAQALAVFEECRVLVQMDVYTQAIERCEEAVRLDPKLPDPYFMLGAAHDALCRRGATTLPEDVTSLPGSLPRYAAATATVAPRSARRLRGTGGVSRRCARDPSRRVRCTFRPPSRTTASRRPD